MISHTGNLRPGFAELLPGWTIDDRPALSARLTRLAEFVLQNGGVEAMSIDEQLQFMWMETHEARLPMPRPMTEPVRAEPPQEISARDSWGEDWRSGMERRS